MVNTKVSSSRKFRGLLYLFTNQSQTNKFIKMELFNLHSHLNQGFDLTAWALPGGKGTSKYKTFCAQTVHNKLTKRRKAAKAARVARKRTAR
jgi:hypothetical protein